MAFEPKRVPDIITLAEDVVFNDVLTEDESIEVLTEPYSRFGLFLKIESAGAPTDIVFKVQFSNDGGTTWWDLQNDFFGDLRYEDTATATAIYEMLKGPCAGRLFQLKAVATGTTAVNTFTISAYLELYR